MLLWFAALSVVIVWAVFQSPALDYRLVALGAAAPVAELAAGRPLVLHTLAGAVGALALVMAATRRRRLLRRRLLGVPIGLFLHLVLDGVWADRDLFWWPAFGFDFAARELPETSRGLLNLGLEVIGAGVLVWGWRRFGLAQPEARRALLRSGRLDDGRRAR
ncbi:MAG: hypothetical protein ACKVWR_15505 [Acidimicrobiales bacterium]